MAESAPTVLSIADLPHQTYFIGGCRRFATLERCFQESMPHFLNELADLATYLVVVCVPIVVAAITIPVGRALAERIRRGKGAEPEPPITDVRLDQLAHRLVALEQAIEVAALEVERLGEQQRYLGKGESLRARAPQRVITPH